MHGAETFAKFTRRVGLCAARLGMGDLPSLRESTSIY